MRITLTTIVVPDYDVAIDYFVNSLGFVLTSDQELSPEKRWVVVSPSTESGHGILLAKAATEEQRQSIGTQTGGRVAFFLETDDFAATHAAFVDRGVAFEEPPRREPFGMVAVFADLFGNRWDLIERKS